MIDDLNINLKLKTRKKLCIGAGGLPLKTIADINFLRLDDKLVIPASTIKGVLRTCMIKVAVLLGYMVKPYVHPDKIADDDVVARLMGKPNEIGRVRVYNAILDYDKTFTLSHVKINDVKGIAEEGGLFTIEYIPSGVTFNSRIESYNVNMDEVRLLLAAIMEMNYARIGKGGLLSVYISNIEPYEEIIKRFNDKVINTLLDNLMGDRHENI